MFLGEKGINSYYSLSYTKGYADGLSQNQQANITYTYHKHTGSPSAEGGCYAGCTLISTTSAAKTDWFGRCPNCGKHTWHQGHTAYTAHFSCGYSQTYAAYVICVSCGAGIHTGAGPDHKCYYLSCGKTENTIESATITYD